MIIKDPKSYYKNMIFKLKIKPIEEEYFDSGSKKIDIEEMENAEKSREDILKQATDDAKHIREEAYLKGIKEGTEKGCRDFEEDTRREIDMLAGIKKEMENFRKEMLKSSEKEIVRLCIAIAEKVIRQKINENDGIVVDCVNKTIKSIPGPEGLMVHLNPGDYDYMHSGKKSIKKILSEYKEIKFVSDRRIEKGGCIIETDGGNIDTQVSSQLKRVYQEIL